MPTNYALEEQKLAERRKVMEALANGGARVPDTGMVQAGASPLGDLVQMLTMRKANQEKQAIDQQQTELQAQQQAEKSASIQSIMNSMMGGQQAMGPTADPNTAFTQQQIPADPRAAIAEGLSSQFPESKAIGSMGLKAMLDEQFKPQTAQELKTVGGIVFDPTTRSIVRLGGGDPAGWATRTNSLGNMEKQNPSTGEWEVMDKAPKINISNTVQGAAAGETELAKSIGRGGGELAMEVFKQLPVAKSTIALADNLERLNQNVPEGPMAPSVVWMGQFAKSIGMPEISGVSDAEQMKGLISREISKYLTAGSGVGRSMTDADREAILSQWPSLSNTREGRAKIIQLLRGNAANVLQQAEQTAKIIETQIPGMGSVLMSGMAPGASNPTAEVPAQPQAQPTVIQWGN